MKHLKYCDFLDFRIPPNSNCRILVPFDAEYNVYFSKTPESEDNLSEQIFLKVFVIFNNLYRSR